MNSFSLRALKLPEDYQLIAELLNSVRQEPITASKLEAADRRIPAQDETTLNAEGMLLGFCRERVVANAANGQVVGYASAWRTPKTEPGIIASLLVVDQAFQKRGVGQALLAHLEDWARAKGASQLVTELPDHLPESREFAEKNGYQIERHVYQSTLDLHSFEETNFAGVVEAAEAQGICFLTLAEWRDVSDDEALYALFHRTALDIPGAPMIPSKEEWLEMTNSFPADYLYIALDDKQPVAMTQMLQNEQTGGLYNEYTGVDAAYRGRGLALVLKLLAIRVGRRLGAPYMRTDNDSTNQAMLLVNQKLGYQPAPGHYRIGKTLDVVQG